MALASKEQVFRSLLTLACECRYRDLAGVYVQSITRLGNELGSEVVRRIADELNDTHAQPTRRKQRPAPGSLT